MLFRCRSPYGERGLKYAVRGVPLDVLAAAPPAERGFLQGARALDYEEQAALLQAAVARTLTGGGRHGE